MPSRNGFRLERLDVPRWDTGVKKPRNLVAYCQCPTAPKVLPVLITLRPARGTILIWLSFHGSARRGRFRFKGLHVGTRSAPTPERVGQDSGTIADNAILNPLRHSGPWRATARTPSGYLRGSPWCTSNHTRPGHTGEQPWSGGGTCKELDVLFAIKQHRPRNSMAYPKCAAGLEIG